MSAAAPLAPVSEREHAAPRSTARDHFERLEKATNLPLALLALLIVPALILEERATTGWLREAAHAINWIVWLAFCADTSGNLRLLLTDASTFAADGSTCSLSFFPRRS